MKQLALFQRNDFISGLCGFSLVLGFLGIVLVSKASFSVMSLCWAPEHCAQVRLYREPTEASATRSSTAKQKDQKQYVILLLQGINSNKELLDPLARALSNNLKPRPWILVPDWAGQGESPVHTQEYHEQLKGVVKAFQARFPEPEFKWVYIAHSLGAGVLMQSLSDLPEPAAVVTYGMDVIASDSPHLLLGVGLFDEFYPAHTLQQRFAQFQAGQAFAAQEHQALIVPASHTLENLNPELMQGILRWLTRWTDMTSTYAATDVWRSSSHWRLVSFFFLLAGALGLALAVSFKLGPRYSVFLFLLCLVIALQCIAFIVPITWLLPLSNLLSFVLFLSGCLAFLPWQSEPTLRPFGQALVLYVWATFMYAVALLFNARTAFDLEHTLRWIHWVRFPLDITLAQVWSGFQALRPHVYLNYSTELRLRPLYWALFLIALSISWIRAKRTQADAVPTD